MLDLDKIISKKYMSYTLIDRIFIRLQMNNRLGCADDKGLKEIIKFWIEDVLLPELDK